jgi:1-deoxy-D-xylulose-5-phosphate synthase
MHEIPVGRGEILRCGRDLAIMAIGSTVYPAIEAAGELALNNIETTVINARFSKPLDSEMIVGVADHVEYIITVEENILSGGFGSNVSNLLQKADINDIHLKNIGLPDEFVEHGSQDILRTKYGLDAKGIARQVHTFFPDININPLLATRGK